MNYDEMEMYGYRQQQQLTELTIGLEELQTHTKK